ncbi:hypothetical protein Misp03_37460 [Microbispora sp. NBRC 16548]|nr:hypothetical protein Misp03_37460 [Microbispora sp. NBRC 16548]
MIATRRQTAAASYVAAVMAVLEEEFPGLRADPYAAETVSDAIRKHALKPGDWLEVIVDAPAVANWRVKADRDHPGRVRLACYRLPDLITADDEAREQRINDALLRIP